MSKRVLTFKKLLGYVNKPRLFKMYNLPEPSHVKINVIEFG